MRCFKRKCKFFLWGKTSTNTTPLPPPPPPPKLPLKIKGDSHSFDIAESEYDKRIVLSLTNVKGERIKATFVIKK